MNDKKIYINRDDIYTGTADPNGVIKAKFKGQLYIDNQNKYYFAEDKDSTVWHYLLTSVNKVDLEQVMNTIKSKIDSVILSENDEGKPVLNFYSNNEIIVSVPIGNVNAFDGITTVTDEYGNKIINFSSNNTVVHTINLGRLDDKFDGALISTNESESEYYLELLSGDTTKVKLQLPATGGGGGSLLPNLTSDFPLTSIGSIEDTFTIEYFFTSPNIGKGTVTYMIDQDETSETIRQGSNKITVGPFEKGEHTVKISVVDVAGLFSNQLTFKIISGGLELTTTYDDSNDLELDNEVVIDYFLSALDPDQIYNLDLTFDGVTSTIENVELGQHYWELGQLDKGVHTAVIKAYNNKLTSNVLEFSLVVTDTTSLYLSTTFKDKQITVGKIPVIDYRISMKDMKKFNVFFTIDDVQVMEAEANLGTNFWSVGELDIGPHVLEIRAETLDGMIESNTLQIPLEVVAFDYVPFEVIEDGIVFNFDGRDNNNSNKERDVWKDRSSNNVLCNLHNFNFTTNGWQGETLKFNGDAYAEINYHPFSGALNNGMTLEIKYKTENIGDLDARVIDCALQKTPFTGLYIDTQQAIFNSALKSIQVYTPERRYNTISFVVDKTKKLMCIYSNAILTKVAWIANNESFDMNKSIFLGGRTDDTFTTKYIKSTDVEIGALNTVGAIDNSFTKYATTTSTIDGTGSFTITCNNDATLIDSIHFFNGERYIDKMENINSNEMTFSVPSTAYSMKITFKRTDDADINVNNINATLRKSDEDILNSAFCEIQTVRMYNRALSQEEIVHNYIADEHDPDKQMELRHLNYDTDGMPAMYFYGDMSAVSKNNRVQIRIRYIDPEDPSKSFDKNNCQVQWQGTSTLAYSVKNFKIRLFDENDPKLKTKEYRKIKDTWLPETVFTLKADYMESSKQNNTGMCRFYGDGYFNDLNPSQAMHPLIRNNIDGFPMLLYINGRLEGVYNFNLDKGAVTLGFEQWLRTDDESDPNSRVIVAADYPEYNKKEHIKINKLLLSDDATDSLDKLYVVDRTVQIGDRITPNNKVMSYEVAANSDVGAGAFATTDWESIKSEFEIRYHPFEDDVINEDETLKEGCHPELLELITWVNQSSDEEFRAEFENHFNKEYMIKYFLAVYTFGMVDNFGKNLMITTWDGKIWYPQFYDLDTQLGLDNTGFVRFGANVDFADHSENKITIDDKKYNDYNTSNSVLWTKLQRCFPTEIKDMYFQLRGTKLTPENVIDHLITNGSNKISQTYYNQDAIQKYLPWGDEYIHMCNGSREGFLRRWIEERFIYMDSIYEYGPNFNTQCTVRANKQGEVRLRIKTYSPTYVKIIFSGASGNYQKLLCDKTGFTEFVGNIATDRDNEIKIFCAGQLMYIDGIKDVYPSVLLLSEASKLVEVDCSGSKNMRSLQLANNKLLQKIVCKNCQYLGDIDVGGNPELNLSGSQHLKYLDASNTKISSVNFADGGALKYCNLSDSRIREVNLIGQQHLPSVNLSNCTELASVALTECNKLKTLNLPNSNITSLTVDNCKSLYYIDLNNSPELRTLDLTGCPNLDTLKVTGLSKSELTELDLSYCNNLTNLDISNSLYVNSIRFSSTYTMLKSFLASNSGITTFRFGTSPSPGFLDLTRFDLDTVDFYNCTNVTEIRGINLDTANTAPFYNCKNLVTLIGNVKISGSANQAFYGCEKLENFPTLDLTEALYLNETFRYCKLLNRSTFENILSQLRNAKILYQTFNGCTGIVYNADETFPSNLLSALTNVEEFSHVFEGCSNMNIKQIPYGFFQPMQRLLRLKYVFCSGTVNGIIPTDILKHNTKLQEVNGLFDHQPNMSGSIPSDLFAYCPDLTTVRGTFLGASGITGEIPENLFANNLLLSNVSDCFSGARGLTGSIPASLFSQNSKLTNARWCFENTNLSGNVPNTLFDNCPLLQDVGYIFSNSKVSGPIPSNLIKNKKSLVSADRMFENCNMGNEEDNFEEFPSDFFEGLTALKTVAHCFSGCKNLKFTVPSKLFNDCINLDTIDYLFYNCKGIHGSLPEDVFVISNGAVTPIKSAVGVFSACSGITGSIPELFMAPFANTIDLSEFFNGCNGISGEIPSSLLYPCVEVIYANRLFKGTGLGRHRVTIDNPYFVDEELFKYNIKLEEINGLFDAADAPRALIGKIPENLFKYNINLIDCGNVFANCTGIIGELNGNLFKYNNKLQSVDTMFFNTGITSISNDLFTKENNPLMNNFTACFKQLTNLTGTAPAIWDFFSSASRNECFLGCTQLSNYSTIPDSWK